MAQTDVTPAEAPRSKPLAFSAGALIGGLGGLIGLGGAEFRLPVLIGIFHFAALEAVIVNKAMSLIVVASALPFRLQSVPLGAVLESWPTILNLLAGSLVGAWLGAGWATRVTSATLYKVIAILLVIMAGLLLVGHGAEGARPLLEGPPQVAAGVVAGLAIGVVAAIMGVAGGELLIPTLVLLFAAPIKLAGSLSLAISLPTMLMGFARYSRDQSFSVLTRHRGFVVAMAAGSVVGTFVGGRLLGLVSADILLPGLAVLLLWSAWKVWRHR